MPFGTTSQPPSAWRTHGRRDRRPSRSQSLNQPIQRIQTPTNSAAGTQTPKNSAVGIQAGKTGIATLSGASVGGSDTRPEPIYSVLVRTSEQCLSPAAQPTGNKNAGAKIAHGTEARSGWSGCRYLRSGEPIRRRCACPCQFCQLWALSSSMLTPNIRNRHACARRESWSRSRN
jgi:hypothetical protein